MKTTGKTRYGAYLGEVKIPAHRQTRAYKGATYVLYHTLKAAERAARPGSAIVVFEA